MKRRPKWWYVGFEKGYFYGIKIFLKHWYWSGNNPLWDCKYYIRKWINNLFYRW